MQQDNTNRYEEFITLRDEMRDLFTNSRQILYWTTGLVIAAFGWFLTPSEQAKVDVHVFVLFLYLSLFISAFSFAVNMNQIYRIGGYIAVFWDSRDTERGLLWHRFNRRGVVGGYLPDAAALIYTVLAGMITAFFVVFIVVSHGRPMMFSIWVVLFGIAETVGFSQMSRIITTFRDNFEAEWIELKISTERQNEIHNVYEPPRLIVP